MLLTILYCYACCVLLPRDAMLVRYMQCTVMSNGLCMWCNAQGPSGKGASPRSLQWNQFFTFRIVWCNFKLAAWFVMLHVKVFYLFILVWNQRAYHRSSEQGPPKPYYATVQLSCVCLSVCHKPVVYRSTTWQIELVLACELPLTCSKLRGNENRLPPKIRPLSSGTLSQTTDFWNFATASRLGCQQNSSSTVEL